MGEAELSLEAIAKAAIAGLVIALAVLALIYVAAPKLLADIFVHALGAVARLWPGA